MQARGPLSAEPGGADRRHRIQFPTVLRGFLGRIKNSGRSGFELKPSVPIPKLVGSGNPTTSHYQYPTTVTLSDLENEVNKIEKYTKARFSRPIHLVHNYIFVRETA